MAGCVLEDPDVGQTSLNATVAEVTNSSCSTSVVLGLATQIADEVNCVAPGKLIAFAEQPHIVFNSSAVMPYLSPAAHEDLVKAADALDTDVIINSGYRTVAQQYLLRQWDLGGRCNIAVAADPGRSNHESGRALDVQNYSFWDTRMSDYGWSQDVAGDPVHFDHLRSADNRGLDVLAFQRLWNRNHPGDVIDEDGVYGPQTESRLKKSPTDGFAEGGCLAAGFDAELVGVTAPGSLAAGDVGEVVVEMKNIGTDPWHPGSTFLGTAAPMDRDSAFYDSATWVSANRPVAVSADTAPGQVGEFVFTIRAPVIANDAAIAESFQLVEETVMWFGPEIDLEVMVTGTGDPGDPGEPGDPDDPGDPGDPGDPDMPPGGAAASTVLGGCSTGGGGQSAWPIALVLAWVIRRRRTGVA